MRYGRADQFLTVVLGRARRLIRRVSVAIGLPDAVHNEPVVVSDGRGYDVRLPVVPGKPSAIAKLTNQFSLCYSMEHPGYLLKKPTNGLVGTTALTAQSGTGKSTLLMHLFNRLRHVHHSAFPFEFSPDLHPTAAIEVAFVPQNPPFVYHWRLGRVLPRGSRFYNALMPSKQFDPTRRLSQFSGGEIRRIYASSCLAFLESSKAPASFLLLDETFDGIGASEMVRCIKDIHQCWTDHVQGRSLQILLVTHHNHQDLLTTIPDSSGLQMSIDPTSNIADGMMVKVNASTQKAPT